MQGSSPLSSSVAPARLVRLCPDHAPRPDHRLKYQPEIDGLRALAVLPVVLFHARVPMFSGGYIGVDVFFVISGYLITGILNEDLKAGHFSILHFYERRIRRIIPALMTVIAFTLVAGIALFLPYQLTDLSWSAINAVTFTSNIWFWRAIGYFAGTTALQPLLHTWSLAVEEQFYVLFPVALWLLHHFRMKAAGVIAAFILSLLAASILVYRMPAATFYLLPTRAWELMLGAMLALGVIPEVWSRWPREGLAVTGAVMILVPIFLYTEKTLFPGLAAVPPCLGTFLIILASQSGKSAVTDLLGQRFLVAIGLISYSLYLWHWPILVFTRQWSIVEPAPAIIAVCIALSFLAAWLSWRFVERPFRTRQRYSRKQVFQYGGTMAAAVGAAALLLTGGLPQRLNQRARLMAAGHDDHPSTIAVCIADAATTFSCPVGASGAPTFAVWGDSHAAALGEAVSLAAAHQGRAGRLYAFNTCPPGAPDDSPAISHADLVLCLQRNQLVEGQLLSDRQIHTIVLVAYWQNYLAQDAAFLDRLAITLDRLRGAGKQVVLLVDLPAPGYDVPLATALAAQFGRPLDTSHSPPNLDPRLASVAAGAGARTISLSPILCPGGQCRTIDAGRPLYFDDNHVTRFANLRLVAPGLERADLFTPPPARGRPSAPSSR